MKKPKARKVKIMLCIYNGTSSWDWTLAEAAFDNHQDSFIDALMEELKYFNLDGIDIDLEGKHLTHVCELIVWKSKRSIILTPV